MPLPAIRNLKSAFSLVLDDDLAVQQGFSTTAMAAVETDRLWSLEEVIGIVDEWEAREEVRP